MNEILDKIAPLLSDNSRFTPFLALFAGVLTSFMPCSLSSIPLIIGYVGGTEQKDTKKSLVLSLIFVSGSAITFTVIGVVASLAGKLIGGTGSWWYILLGVLMVLMALQMWGLFEIIPSGKLLSKSTKKGKAGAFIAGILAGVFSSPCSTPVLVALIALSATQGNILWGILLFILYSIGHGVLAVIAGTSVGFVKKLTSSEKYGKVGNILNIVLGIFILLIGLYMFYLGF